MARKPSADKNSPAYLQGKISSGRHSLLLFLLCWFLSKKRSGWLIPALVLFVLDTLALAWCTLNLVNDPAGNIVDFVFHFWAIWELCVAIRCSSKLKKLPQDIPGDNFSTLPELDS